MEINKIMTCRIDLMTGIYERDFDEILLAEVRAHFEGKCKDACFVKKINKILSTSELVCCQDTLDGRVQIQVTFDATVLVYRSGDILYDCKVVKVIGNIVFAVGDDIAVSAKVSEKLLHVYKPDTVVPFIAQNINYSPYAPQITIKASELRPFYQPLCIYEISPGPDQKEPDFSVIDELLADEKKWTPKQREIAAPFERITYPFAEKREFSKKYPEFTFASIREIPSRRYMCIPSEMPALQGGAYFAQKLSASLRNTKVVSIDSAAARELILGRYEQALRNRNGFVRAFETNFEKLVALWTACVYVQKQNGLKE